MAGPDLRTASAGAAGGWMAAALIGLACACSLACTQTPQPVQRTEAAADPPGETATAPATVDPAIPENAATPAIPAIAAQPGAPTAPAASAASAPAAAGGGRPGFIVLDPGEETNSPKTLVDAARAERERRARAGKPAVVITDKTLPHLAKGQLTYAQPKKADGNANAGEPGPLAGSENATGQDEAYWRGRAREIRGRWHDASEEIGRLEQSAADLRRRFYAEDDPYRRDVQIKPEWDHALDELSRRRDEARAAQRELDAFLEEGRRAGALPGWLREGSELEPASPPESAGPAHAMEPPEAEGSGAIEPPELGEGPPDG